MSIDRTSDEDPTSVFKAGDVFSTWDYDYYQPLGRRMFDRAIPAMLEMLGARPGDQVLDAGCGPGEHSIRAARFGCRVHAIDVSDRVLSEARARVEAAGLGDAVTFEQQDLTQLSLADESFDRIFSWGVITHIPDMEKVLGELVRVLRPGGRLALETTNARAWDHKAEALARWVLRKPSVPRESLEFGVGQWYSTGEERLWVWYADTEAVTRHLAGLGLRRTHKVAMNFTNLQWRLKGFSRTCLLQVNNAWFASKLPAGPAATNLLVFEKSG